MPAASDDQVPKPLTYTLMYHFLWFVLFLLSAVTFLGVFWSAGWGFGMAVLPPMLFVVLALIAGVGAFATYVVRVQLMLGEISKEDGFRWSSRSSWAVIAFVPVLFLLTFALESWIQTLWQQWPVPVSMTVTAVKVELVVWWISHLMSVRGLARGRKHYLAPAVRPATA